MILYESYYGVTPLGSDSIQHYGSKGMKWHHRRWQNPDGSYTAAGRVHYGIGQARTDKDIKKDLRAAADGDKSAEYRLLHYNLDRDVGVDLTTKNEKKYQAAKQAYEDLKKKNPDLDKRYMIKTTRAHNAGLNRAPDYTDEEEMYANDKSS